MAASPGCVWGPFPSSFMGLLEGLEFVTTWTSQCLPMTWQLASPRARGERERERLTLASALFRSTKSSPDSTGSEYQVVWTTGDNPGQREQGKQRTAWKLPAVSDSGESGWCVSHLDSSSRGRRRRGVLVIVRSANSTSCLV